MRLFPQLAPVFFDLRAPHVNAFAKHDNLPEALRLFVRKAHHCQPSKVIAEQLQAVQDLFVGNHENEHTMRHKPAEGVIKEEPLQTPVPVRLISES